MRTIDKERLEQLIAAAGEQHCRDALSLLLAAHKRFDVLAGLSDHTMGTTASVASIALGACLIEKHFTLRRADKESEFTKKGGLHSLPPNLW